MTEPVAYIYNYANGDYALWHKTEQHIEKAIPLYTKEQLHPRVKMTQAEFDEWKDLYNGSLMFSEAIKIMDLDEGNNYKNICEKIWVMDGEVSIENEAIFSRLYADFDPDNPEETIEIVPNMKWFVRSKKSELNGYGWLSIIDKYQTPIYQYSHDKPLSIFVRFDTKEEAEKWTNPLTEAVQLPVEDE